MNKAAKNSMQESKVKKSLNANEKSLAEFYLGLTVAIHFQMLMEQKP